MCRGQYRKPALPRESRVVFYTTELTLYVDLFVEHAHLLVAFNQLDAPAKVNTTMPVTVNLTEFSL